MFKKFTDKATEFAKNLWLFLRPKAKAALETGVIVVEKMKNLVEDPAMDIFVQITPTKLDDVGMAQLRIWLPKILVSMKLVNNCKDQTDPQEIVRCAVRTLQQVSGDWLDDVNKKNMLDSLAVTISVVASDGKLDWNDAKYVMKFFYDNVYKPKMNR